MAEGFRRPGTNLMDAYQYFHDRDGEQAGWVHTGTLEFDEREGHTHWHFTDFARYRLLKADRQEAVRQSFDLTDLPNGTTTSRSWPTPAAACTRRARATTSRFAR